jgi:hypothetical protein
MFSRLPHLRNDIFTLVPPRFFLFSPKFQISQSSPRNCSPGSPLLKAFEQWEPLLWKLVDEDGAGPSGKWLNATLRSSTMAGKSPMAAGFHSHDYQRVMFSNVCFQNYLSNEITQKRHAGPDMCSILTIVWQGSGFVSPAELNMAGAQLRMQRRLFKRNTCACRLYIYICDVYIYKYVCIRDISQFAGSLDVNIPGIFQDARADCQAFSVRQFMSI